MASAPDFVTFYVEMSQARLETIEGRTTVARELFSILTSLDDELRREEYLKRMAQVLNLNEWSVRSEYQKAARQSGRRIDRAAAASQDVPRINTDDCDFLASIMSLAPLRAKVEEAVGNMRLPGSPFVEALTRVLRGAGPEAIHEFEDETARRMYTAATSQEPPDSARAEILVDKRLARLERDVLLEESARLQEAIRKAEHEKDSARLMELLPQKMSIDKRIQKLGAA